MENHQMTTSYKITKTYNISNYDYRITNIILGKSVHLVVIFKDDNGIYQREQSVNIYDEDYNNWGTDDNYIHQYIEANLDKLLS